MLRDRLLARLKEMGDVPDYVRLASEVLGIRNAPPALARRLVSQALVVEDRRDVWVQTGERICAAAPQTAGVYVLRDADGKVLYVGKAINLRRRLRTHFAPRRWRGLKAALARAADAEWQEVGSELEALLREAVLIRELRPAVNVQVGAPEAGTRAIPAALARDVIVLVPSIDAGAVEMIAARADGGWMQMRVARLAGDLEAESRRLFRFFHSPLHAREDPSPLAPIVFSWLAGRGAAATRVDPHGVDTVAALAARLRILLNDDDLFTERLEVR